LAQALARDAINTRYAAGMDAMNDFSKKNFTGHGIGSKYSPATPNIESAGAALLREYEREPHREDPCNGLGEPTVARK